VPNPEGCFANYLDKGGTGWRLFKLVLFSNKVLFASRSRFPVTALRIFSLNISSKHAIMLYLSIAEPLLFYGELLQLATSNKPSTLMPIRTYLAN
jgi:hypothetical protein